MILSMEIGHKSIRAVIMESGQVQKSFQIEAPSVLAGHIENIAETGEDVKNALVEHNITVKNCQIVLPSSLAVIRELQVPRIVLKDMKGYIRTQFSGFMELQGEDIVDGLVTHVTDEISTVLGYMIRRPQIEQCISLAKNAGLKCQKIDLRMNALRKFMGRENMPGDSACIVAHLENGKVEINLFENKKLFIRTVELSREAAQESDNLLKNWAMSFNDALVTAPDQASWTAPLANQIENIINFQLSRNRQMPVKAVYLCGDTDEHMTEELSRLVQIPARLLCQGEALPFVYAKGAGLPGDAENDINLVTTLKVRTPAEKQNIRRYLIFGGILAALIIIQLGAGMFLGHLNNKTKQQMDEIQSYLSNSKLLQSLARAKDVQKVLDEQIQYNQILKLFNDDFDQRLRFNSFYIKGIYDQALVYNISLEYCDYKDGKLSIIGYAGNSSIAAQFAAALEQNGTAAQVTFQGYEKNDQKDSDYKFQLSGDLKEGS